jgi:ankyrin repeat protein
MEETGKDILLRCPESKSYNIMFSLLDAGYNPNSAYREIDGGESLLLLLMIEKAPTEIIKKLVENYEVNVNRKNREGVTPLIMAVAKGRIDLLEFFISKKANINSYYYVAKKSTTYTALDDAEELEIPNKEKIIEILKKNGALSSKDLKKETDKI